MYTERFSLPFLSRVLIAAAERRRPGLGRWSAEVREQLRGIFQQELVELRARYFEIFDDAAYWERTERALLEDCFARYAAVAQRQTELEQRDYGLWRGGDLVSRIVLGAGGIAVGVFLSRAPFIPIPTSGDVVVMLTSLGAPFLPDLQVWMHERRYRKRIDAIVRDMEAAQEQQKLYPPLTALEPVQPPDPVAPISEAPQERAPGGTRHRERG